MPESTAGVRAPIHTSDAVMPTVAIDVDEAANIGANARTSRAPSEAGASPSSSASSRIRVVRTRAYAVLRLMPRRAAISGPL